MLAETVHSYTQLTNIVVNSVMKKSPDYIFYGDMNRRRPYRLYREFGRVGWVTKTSMVRRLDARSIMIQIP